MANAPAADLPAEQAEDLRNFLESETERADSHQKYLIALVASAFAGLYFVSRNVDTRILDRQEILLVGIGLGAAAYMLVGARLIAHLIDVLQPRKMAFMLNPTEAVAIDRCVENLGLPGSARLMKVLPVATGFAYLLMLYVAMHEGYGPHWLVVFGFVIALVDTVLELAGAFATSKFIRVHWAKMHAVYWEKFGITKGMTAEDANIKRILEVAQLSALPPTPENASVFVRAYQISGRFSGVGGFLLHSAVATAVGLDLLHALGVGQTVALLLPVATFSFLVFVAAAGFILVALDPWKAHLGQLRFVALIQSFSHREIAVAYIALEALRERRIFYAFPVGLLIDAMRDQSGVQLDPGS